MPSPQETNGNAVFASTQYWSEAGPGGYMGTQVWLDKDSKKETHKAIFSMWDADNSTLTGFIGENCGR